MDLMERFSNAGVVPVVVLEDAGQALSTARALLAGGIDVMEITFRTDAARDAIQIVAEQCPDMLVGAGTVCSVEQCRQAAEAGARFIVSPGFDPCVVDWCLEHELTVLPGCVTPSEIMEALSRGISTVKFFPASIYGGLEAMKALSGPFVGLQFVPTGGINAANLAEYAKAPFVRAVGGSWLFGDVLGGGLIGIWIAMVGDWMCRAICFAARLISGKWLKYAPGLRVVANRKM